VNKLDYDAIIADAGSGTPGMKTWTEKLSDRDRDELYAIRARWVASGRRPPASTLARTLIAHCKAAGIPIVGETQVTRWLRSDQQ
jgi:hypothetical protein